MTEKQRKYIEWICEMLEIEFTGTTKRDAWKFINKYKDKAHEIKNGEDYDYAYCGGTDLFYVPDEDYYYCY